MQLTVAIINVTVKKEVIPMEKYLDVMKQSYELVDTIVEGLEHIQQLLKDGSLEQTLYLVEDVIVGYSTVERSILPISEELENDTISSLTNEVKVALRQLANAYEEQKHGEVQEVLQFHVLPLVKKWKRELDEAFAPYTIS